MTDDRFNFWIGVLVLLLVLGASVLTALAVAWFIYYLFKDIFIAYLFFMLGAV